MVSRTCVEIQHVNSYRAGDDAPLAYVGSPHQPDEKEQYALSNL